MTGRGSGGLIPGAIPALLYISMFAYSVGIENT